MLAWQDKLFTGALRQACVKPGEVFDKGKFEEKGDDENWMEDLHFAFEEEHLQKINYADLKKYRYQHEFFTKNLLGKLQEERAGKLVLNTEVMRLLMNWLQDHILQEDMKYSSNR